MEAKIRIKLGALEVEYEGSEAFLKEQLLSFLSELTQIQKNTVAASSTQFIPSGGGDTSTGRIRGTTQAIATKLHSAKAPDLVIAAAAHFTFVANTHTFSRQNLLDEMKTAAGYYKKSIGSNLTQSLLTLVKDGRLLETAKDTYSLSDAEKKELEGKLAS